MNSITTQQRDSLVREITHGVVTQYIMQLLQVDTWDDHYEEVVQLTDRVYHAILPTARSMTANVHTTDCLQTYAGDFYGLALQHVHAFATIPAELRRRGAQDSVLIWQDTHAHEWDDDALETQRLQIDKQWEAMMLD